MKNVVVAVVGDHARKASQAAKRRPPQSPRPYTAGSSNARGDAAPVHLWDEIVGHLLWYGGLALLVAVLARGFAVAPRRAGRWSGTVAVLTGLTWTTNALGADGLLLAGLAAAVALSAYGWWIRTSGAGQLLLLGFLPSTAGLLAALLAT